MTFEEDFPFFLRERGELHDVVAPHRHSSRDAEEGALCGVTGECVHDVKVGCGGREASPRDGPSPFFVELVVVRLLSAYRDSR